mmetsp:Transcript_114148/g.323231  ORF Transcript_114148/g.323231 Transcript_114148/m.323231 type:complete len:340 (+) Transcript_114148:59-1078(+)
MPVATSSSARGMATPSVAERPLAPGSLLRCQIDTPQLPPSSQVGLQEKMCVPRLHLLLIRVFQLERNFGAFEVYLGVSHLRRQLVFVEEHVLDAVGGREAETLLRVPLLDVADKPERARRRHDLGLLRGRLRLLLALVLQRLAGLALLRGHRVDPGQRDLPASACMPALRHQPKMRLELQLLDARKGVGKLPVVHGAPLLLDEQGHLRDRLFVEQRRRSVRPVGAGALLVPREVEAVEYPDPLRAGLPVGRDQELELDPLPDEEPSRLSVYRLGGQAQVREVHVAAVDLGALDEPVAAVRIEAGHHALEQVPRRLRRRRRRRVPPGRAHRHACPHPHLP